MSKSRLQLPLFTKDPRCVSEEEIFYIKIPLPEGSKFTELRVKGPEMKLIGAKIDYDVDMPPADVHLLEYESLTL